MTQPNIRTHLTRAFAIVFLIAGATWFFTSRSTAADAPAGLKLNKGDHIAIVGNTLADRIQHDGWFESYIHAKYPEHELVIRNLAAAGDEVVTRNRSENFGSPDDWLGKTGADVVFAFFGFNESFKGQAGIEQFKANLEKYLKDVSTKNYSGKRHAPHRALFPDRQRKNSGPQLP